MITKNINLNTLRDKVSLLDLIQNKYGIKLKKAGKEYQGLCPFHEEKSPSFSVNPETNLYRCFGCNAGGDAIKFVQEKEKTNFQDAVTILADFANISLNDNYSSVVLPFKSKYKYISLDCETLELATLPPSYIKPNIYETEKKELIQPDKKYSLGQDNKIVSVRQIIREYTFFQSDQYSIVERRTEHYDHENRRIAKECRPLVIYPDRKEYTLNNIDTNNITLYGFNEFKDKIQNKVIIRDEGAYCSEPLREAGIVATAFMGMDRSDEAIKRNIKLLAKCGLSYLIDIINNDTHGLEESEKVEKACLEVGLNYIPIQVKDFFLDGYDVPEGADIGDVITYYEKQQGDKLSQELIKDLLKKNYPKTYKVIGDPTADRIGGSPKLDKISYSDVLGAVGNILEKYPDPVEREFYLNQLTQEWRIEDKRFVHKLAAKIKDDSEYTDSDLQDFEKLLKTEKINLHDIYPQKLAEAMYKDGDTKNVDPLGFQTILLPAIAILLGKKRHLRFGSWKIIANLFTALIGGSGLGKSPIMSVILDPIETMQKAATQQYKVEKEKYKEYCQIAKKNKESEPPEPVEKVYSVKTATIPWVFKALAEQKDNGILWNRDELKSIFAYGQYSKSENEYEENILELYDGRDTYIRRVDESKCFEVFDPRFCITGGIQPELFTKVFKDASDSNGLQARFLYSSIERRPNKINDGYCLLSDILPDLYQWVNDLDYLQITVSQEAKTLYQNFVENEIEAYYNKASNKAMANWLAKYQGHILRIALILHHIDLYFNQYRNHRIIEVDTMRRAIALGEYYRKSLEALQTEILDKDELPVLVAKIYQKAQKMSSSGLSVRDAVKNIRGIKTRALNLRKKEAEVAEELFYLLMNEGKGEVRKVGKSIKFFAVIQQTQKNQIRFVPNVPNTPEKHTEYEIELAPNSRVSMSPICPQSTDKYREIKINLIENRFKAITDSNIYSEDEGKKELKNMRIIYMQDYMDEAKTRIEPSKRTLLDQWLIDLDSDRT